MKQMKLFLTQLFCRHYWGDGVPVISTHPTGAARFTCALCGCKKVKSWNWAGVANSKNYRTTEY